jgi:cytochrome c biogenesis protein CcdA
MDNTTSIGHLTPQWVDFFIMAGAIALVAIGALIWVFYFRKPVRRRRKYRHHHERRLTNPTLAQNGGLPPVRQGEKPPVR